MKPWFLALALIASPIVWPNAAHAAPPREGVDVGAPSMLNRLVAAEPLERQAAQQYGELKRQAAAKNALAPEGEPQLQRLRAANEYIGGRKLA